MNKFISLQITKILFLSCLLSCIKRGANQGNGASFTMVGCTRAGIHHSRRASFSRDLLLSQSDEPLQQCSRHRETWRLKSESIFTPRCKRVLGFMELCRARQVFSIERLLACTSVDFWAHLWLADAPLIANEVRGGVIWDKKEICIGRKQSAY